MPIAGDKVRNEPRKLRQSLKKLRADLSAERVHQVRTRTRRLEAHLHALALEGRKNERRLLEAIRPVRKRAGRVRDMDVLEDLLLSVQLDSERECSRQLLDDLVTRRKRRARKLHKTARFHSPEAARRLKRCAKFLDHAFDKSETAVVTGHWSSEAAALALQLEGELRNWPRLSRSNLHPFRLKVKQLREVLQMAQAEDQFIGELGDAKDAIGEWHDWEELSAIAAKVLQHRGCELRARIRSTAEQKFKHASALANRLRQQWLGTKIAQGARKPPSRAVQPAMKSASALAA